MSDVPANHARRKYATTGHPSIAAALENRYRFSTEAEAWKQLAAITQHFIQSKLGGKDSPVLWIRGYALAEAEKQAGYLGHFAQLSVVRLDDGHGIVAEKLPVPLEKHPTYKRAKRSHPDWGHPILRGVKKAKRYPSFEAAQADLDRLHKEYPTISIPGEGKLYIIIYQPLRGKKPVQKYKLRIQPAEDAFIIACRENTYRRKPVDDTPKPMLGFFTSLVKRTKKK